VAKRLILASVLALAACTRKPPPAPRDAAPAPAPVSVVVDAAVEAVDAAPAPLPSATLVAEGLGPVLIAGPARTPDRAQLVWCTQGGIGVADWVETVCHQAGPGKKTIKIPVMTYADAMAIDDGVDPAASDAAGIHATDARARVAAAVARLGTIGDADLVAMPRPVRCSFAAGEFTGRDDAATAADPGTCAAGGLTVAVTAQGKVSVVRAGKALFTEVLAPRGRPECALEVDAVELSIDAGAELAALAIAMGNANDACVQIAEFEVRALRLP
jgi:hypothetical protein